MHRKPIRRWPKLVALILALAGLWGGLVAQSVLAEQPSPLPTCFGVSCTVTFDATDVAYLWVSPPGAVDLKFELYGAQGGQGAYSLKASGLGGRVSGALQSTPSQLFVYVGGRGASSSGALGGFNGGGNAGKGHGDEGSGGGASDLRLTPSLADRLAVAGGGGGAGGFNWANVGLGGSGGSLDAEDGGWGQAAPGLGGTQLAGGASGRPNGGAWGTAGQLGQGGNGSSSSFAGGGGGGGGYFGGGGGGSDLDTCCFNAGGGGGGSSYARAESTTAVKHFSGVREGNGLVILKYTLGPIPTPTSLATSSTPTPTATVTPTTAPTPTPSLSPTAASVPISVASSSPTPSPPVTSPSPTPSPTSAAVVAASTPSPSASPALRSTPILEPSQAAVVISAPSYSSPPAVPQTQGPAQGSAQESVTIGAPLTEQPTVLQPIESAPIQLNSRARAANQLGASKEAAAEVSHVPDVSLVPDVSVVSEVPEITGDSNQAISTQTVVNSRQPEVVEHNPMQTMLWLILGFCAIGFALASFALVRNMRASSKLRRRSFVLVS